MQLLRGRTTSVDALAISPDGRYVVAGGPGACDAWDLRDPKASPRALDRSDARTHRLTFASDTTLVTFRESRRGVEGTGWLQYDLESGAGVELVCPMLPIPERVIVHPSGRLLKAGPHQRGPITTLRLDGGGREWVTVNDTKHDYNWLLAFNTSGDRYVAREHNYRNDRSNYCLRDTATDAAVVRFERRPDWHPFDLDSWAFTPDGRRAFAVSFRALFAYDCVAGGQPAVSLELPEGGAVESTIIYSNSRFSDVQALAVHPDGLRVATVEEHRTVSLRDAETLQVLRSYDFAMPKVTCVAFTPDGTRCVIANTRGKVLLFDVE